MTLLSAKVFIVNYKPTTIKRGEHEKFTQKETFIKSSDNQKPIYQSHQLSRAPSFA